MKKLLLLISISCTTIFYGQEIHQQLVSSSGDNFETPTLLYSFSLGECMVETYYTPNVVFVQGLHQLTGKMAYPVYPRGIININLHPNPAINEIWIDISDEKENLEGLSLSIFDLTGKLLAEQKISNYHELVDISALFRHTLIIRISKNNQLLIAKTIQRIY